MKKLIVNIEGHSDSDIENALDEVTFQVRQGFTSGMNENETGRYDFDVSGEDEPEIDDEATTPPA